MLNVIFTTLFLSSSINADDSIIQNVSSLPIMEKQVQQINSNRNDTYLRYSGNVELSGSVNNVRLFNGKDALKIEITYTLDVDSETVDYSEMIKYEGELNPYFDYTVDKLGFYPASNSKIYSISNNDFTQTEISNSEYELIKSYFEDAIKKSYIEGLTQSEIRDAEKNFKYSKYVSNNDLEGHQTISLHFKR
ncbi:hypothetical protein L1267_11030 [Pseudoalteromonas sp. OFAV1]|uniref:hypothetical protein n=1 Tax=Pseudoalteromonas sp. OFAV1 TaxID=2908892 RepID=UPI001F1B3993|nr:hypothetical protein [Pseudoalteromonas sp. OFAV1]MCF2900937.1 hypothetical protein [Pseudoalteromonas sp. OFAV1]